MNLPIFDKRPPKEENQDRYVQERYAHLNPGSRASPLQQSLIVLKQQNRMGLIAKETAKWREQMKARGWPPKVGSVGISWLI